MERFSWSRFLKSIPLQFQVLLVVGTAVVAFVLLQFGLPALAKPAQATVALTTRQGHTSSYTGEAQIPTASPLALSTPTPGPTPTLLAPQGGIIYAVQPTVKPGRVGRSRRGREPLWRFPPLHGTSEGKVHHGAFQFDLSFLAAGYVILLCGS